MMHWILVDEQGRVRRRAVGHRPPAVEGKTWQIYKDVGRKVMPFHYDEVHYDAVQYRLLDFGGHNETNK